MSVLLRSLWTRGEDTTSTPDELRSQWSNPSDILSLLLLIGSDVVQRALAQQVGHKRWKLPTPVVFSFGWVAYGFMALSSAVGENKLMPMPDVPCTVVGTREGHWRNNESWILGRLVRDFESKAMTPETKKKLDGMLEKASEMRGERTVKAGLCVSILRASESKDAGQPTQDLWWWSGFAVAFVQLGIAAIPWGLYGQWEIFVIVICGTTLAFSTGSLPQWHHERYACRHYSKTNFVLTRGNGSQHAIVILGQGRSLDLEDLSSISEAASASYITRLTIGFFAFLWVALLITVSGIKENTWYLVAIGGIGMVHTSFIAGAPRDPSTFGIHIEPVESFVDMDVMPVLEGVEQKYPGIGRSMLTIFFPGELWDDEKVRWNQYREKEKKLRALEKNRKKTQTVVEMNVPAHPTDRPDEDGNAMRLHEPTGAAGEDAAT